MLFRVAHGWTISRSHSVEVLLCRSSIGDRRDDAHLAAAVGAGLHVQSKSAGEQSRPEKSILAVATGLAEVFNHFRKRGLGNFFKAVPAPE